MTKGIIIMKSMASSVQSEIFSPSMEYDGVEGFGESVVDEAGKEGRKGRREEGERNGKGQEQSLGLNLGD